MYKITLLFESDVRGIYTQEIETADSLSNAEFKRDRMLYRWLNIISNDLSINNHNGSYLIGSSYELNYKFQYELLQLFIKYLNLRGKEDRDRTFSIVIEEFDENKI